MFNSCLQEAVTKECYMKEDSVPAFEIFTSHVYTNRVPDDHQSITASTSIFGPLVDFYILADKLLLPAEVKTQAVDTLVKARAKSKLAISSLTVNNTLLKTAEDCPLRRLVVDIMWIDYLYMRKPNNWLGECFRNVPGSQCVETVGALRETFNFASSGKQDPCEKMITEGQSVAQVPRYQTGYLKVNKEPFPS